MISREAGNNESTYATFDPFAPRRRKRSVFYIECRRCGFEPEDQCGLPLRVCPKCHSDSWERVLRPRSLLHGKVGRRYRISSPT